jgi:hypothetical protein
MGCVLLDCDTCTHLLHVLYTVHYTQYTFTSHLMAAAGGLNAMHLESSLLAYLCSQTAYIAQSFNKQFKDLCAAKNYEQNFSNKVENL